MPPRKIKRSTCAALGVFARAPVPGSAKTRLIPLLGAVGAARFQSAMLADTLRKVSRLRRAASPYLFLAGRKSGLTGAVKIPPEVKLARQTGGLLGDRLESAFRRLFKQHQRAVIIGTDSPLLPPSMIRLALHELNQCDSVLGPCPDGGYYLIGLRAAPAPLRDVLRDVRWSTRFAFWDTLRSFTSCGLSCSILEEWEDVDLPADVMRLRRSLGRNPGARPLARETWRFLQDSL
ncbi:MAG: TIGR04282 family arsenosugar biosynthesis glycosyltransferase [Terriglobia bacterium]